MEILSGSQKPVTQGRVISKWPPSAFPQLFGECCSLGTGRPLLAAWSSLSSIPQSNPSRRSRELLSQQKPLILASVPPGGERQASLWAAAFLLTSAIPSVPTCAQLPGGDSVFRVPRVGCEGAGETSQPPLTPTPTQASRMKTGEPFLGKGNLSLTSVRRKRVVLLLMAVLFMMEPPPDEGLCLYPTQALNALSRKD